MTFLAKFEHSIKIGFTGALRGDADTLLTGVWRNLLNDLLGHFKMSGRVTFDEGNGTGQHHAIAAQMPST